MRGARGAAVAAALLLLVPACGSDDGTARQAFTSPAPSPAPADRGDPGHDGSHGDAADPAPPPEAAPLRAGERFVDVAMPEAYTPSAPYEEGTDDYRCFLLDPGLTEDGFITGLDVQPGTPEVVHHVILFRVPPEAVAEAETRDAQDEGEGWTCFGGAGVGDDMALDDAPWLGAWAPGGGEQVMAPDVGVPVAAGSRVVLQVHYNLLAGPEPDVTATRLRMAPGDADLAGLETMLLPAPVELPCRPGEDGPLCDREAAAADVVERFGPAGRTADMLHLLCGREPPGPRQYCDRTVQEPATIRAAAGHMHLLGRSLRIDVNPGTDRARRVLEIPVWDFDDQGARAMEPVALRAGDSVRVTCEHDQALRDRLPAFEGQEERYVVWGEGTTDEMCLGMLMVTRP